MAIELSLEIEVGLRESDFLAAAYASGAVAAAEEDSTRDAVYPGSGLDVFVRTEFYPDSVLTEGLSKPALWKVGMRVTLRYFLPEYDACNRDVSRLVTELAVRSPVRFVLSFQNENAYAIRDEEGLRFIAGTGLGRV